MSIPLKIKTRGTFYGVLKPLKYIYIFFYIFFQIYMPGKLILWFTNIPSLLGNPLKQPTEVNTTSSVNMHHLHTASLGDLSPLPCERRGVLRHRSTIAPGKLGWGGEWQTPCRTHISEDGIQRSWSLYALEHNRLALIKPKACDKRQPWWSIGWDISYWDVAKALNKADPIQAVSSKWAACGRMRLGRCYKTASC